MSLVTGLWRRGAMRFPDGRVDQTTRVYWLQTQSLYADIRVPADLICRPEVTGFDDLRDEELIGLAALYGFAGTLDFDGEICRWHRELDYRPPGGPADEARASLDGDTLIETGLNADYVEDWYRQTPRDAPLVAFRAIDGIAGILVIAGDHFIEIRDRPVPLAAGSNLARSVAAVLAEHDRAAAAAKLGMRISYGRRTGSTGEPSWRIELSTFPWLVGTRLFAASAWHGASATLTLDDGARVWSMVSSSLGAAELAEWFA